MSAASAAASSADKAPTIAEASPASTIGSCLDRDTLLQFLKAALLRPPRQFKGKPVTVVTCIGLSGSGKSVYINTLLSIINGSPFSLQNSASAAEAAGGTLSDQYIPVHELLFPGVEDPPAYFFLVDTQGFKAHANAGDVSNIDYTVAGDVTSKVSRLLRGFLPSYGGSMQTGSIDDDLTDAPPLPAQAVLCVVSGQQLSAAGTDNEKFRKSVSIITASSKFCGDYKNGLGNAVKLPHAAEGVPLYALITQAEKLLEKPGEKPPMDESTGIDHWDTMLREPRVVPIVQRVSRVTSVQYARVRYTFGLNTLRPGNGTDIRELAALIPLVDIVREVVARDLVLHQQQLLIKARDNPQQELRPIGVPRATGAAYTPSLPFMSVAQLKLFLLDNPKTAKAAPMAEAQEISGDVLIRMTDDEIREVFDRHKNFGLCKSLQLLIAPFRAAALLADAGTIVSAAPLRAEAAISGAASGLVRKADYLITTTQPLPPAPVSRVVGRWYCTANQGNGAQIPFAREVLCNSEYVKLTDANNNSITINKTGDYLLLFSASSNSNNGNNCYYEIYVGTAKVHAVAGHNDPSGYFGSTQITYPAHFIAGETVHIKGYGTHPVRAWPDGQMAAMLGLVFLC